MYPKHLTQYPELRQYCSIRMCERDFLVNNVPETYKYGWGFQEFYPDPKSRGTGDYLFLILPLKLGHLALEAPGSWRARMRSHDHA